MNSIPGSPAPVHRIARWALLFGLLALPGTHIAATAQEKTSEFGTTYIGTIKEAPASARVAVAVDKNTVTAYICSTDAAFNQKNARWFKGTLNAEGNLTATGGDGEKLTGKLQGKTLVLTAKLGDRTLLAEATEVPLSSSAGLYRQEDKVKNEERITGWILDPSGKIAGAVQGKIADKIQAPQVKLGGGKIGPAKATVTITKAEIVPTIQGLSGIATKVTWEANKGLLAGAKITGFVVERINNPVDKKFKPNTNKFDHKPEDRVDEHPTSDVPPFASFDMKVTMFFETVLGKSAVSAATTIKNTP